jgi:predicted nuclease of restriction endonuclease-like RecB superfamily
VLTADLVEARRTGGELRLTQFDDEKRARALEIAESLVEAAGAHVGATREELDAALDAIDVGPRDVRLKAGLRKLLEDASDLSQESDLDPVKVRATLFARAAEARRTATTREAWTRETLVREAAEVHETTSEAIERALFADLRGAQVLRGMPQVTAAALVAEYDRGRAQAVLLRAVRVTVDVVATPGAARALFRKLKFLRLLHTIDPHEGGHRIVIDGPFALFEAATKYGLELAMVLPALEGCEAWSLVAEVRWGKERVPLVFRLVGGAGRPARAPVGTGAGAAKVTSRRRAKGSTAGPPPGDTEDAEAEGSAAASLPDDVSALALSFAKLDSGWRVSPASAILTLPGVGLCVPDLVFEKDGAKVFLEVMGYWSRDAVWKRVELVERGLGAPVVFAVSSRLRVSEEVLDPGRGGALYVYKGTMRARAVEERLEAVRAQWQDRSAR